MNEPFYTPLSVLATGIAGRCPRCGQGHMFAGFISLATACEVCGLDFSFADSGDGPSVFVSLVGGFIVLGLAMLAEIFYEPPYWVFAVIFLPMTLLVCVGLLRPFKGILIAQQYRTKAQQREF